MSILKATFHHGLLAQAHLARMREIKIKAQVAQRISAIEHQIRMDAIARKSQELATTHANIRRQEERRMVTATRLLCRRIRPDETITVSRLRKFHRQRIESHLASLPVTGRVLEYQGHIEALVKEHAIDASFEALPATNAYAWASRRRVEFSPIVSAESYAVALHELGHVLRPCQDDHVRVTDDHKSRCVGCELEAWRFAIITALDWTKSMHSTLSDALSTYREFARRDEDTKALDAMVSRRGYYDARMLRVTEVTS